MCNLGQILVLATPFPIEIQSMDSLVISRRLRYFETTSTSHCLEGTR